MKTKSNITDQPKFIIAGLVLLAFGFIIGALVSDKRVPRNCSELSVDFLEMGKKYYGLTGSSPDWGKAVEVETELMNVCLKQFPKQFPWEK